MSIREASPDGSTKISKSWAAPLLSDAYEKRRHWQLQALIRKRWQLSDYRGPRTESYERRIETLERENEDLRRSIALLKVELEDLKKRSNAFVDLTERRI